MLIRTQPARVVRTAFSSTFVIGANHASHRDWHTEGGVMNRSPQIGLDHVIWTALTTRQAHLGQGNALARRYHPDVAPFAALASDTPAAYEALHQLLPPQEQVALLSEEPVTAIDALQTTPVGDLHQMVATRREAGSADDRDVISLGHADAKEMLDLVQKAKPGPFARRTPEMGNYMGFATRDASSRWPANGCASTDTLRSAPFA